MFTSTVECCYRGDRIQCRGETCSTKKNAEQSAAQKACSMLKITWLPTLLIITYYIHYCIIIVIILQGTIYNEHYLYTRHNNIRFEGVAIKPRFCLRHTHTWNFHQCIRHSKAGLVLDIQPDCHWVRYRKLDHYNGGACILECLSIEDQLSIKHNIIHTCSMATASTFLQYAQM